MYKNALKELFLTSSLASFPLHNDISLPQQYYIISCFVQNNVPEYKGMNPKDTFVKPLGFKGAHSHKYTVNTNI